MILLGTPEDLKNFVVVDNDLSYKLQQNGFAPMYRDDKFLYYKKSRKLSKLINQLRKE